MANINGELFPVLGQKPLVGVAKLAAEAEQAGERHMIEFKALKVRSILNWSASKRRTWMAYSVNPYRGCEFGCKYCYARYTHTFLKPGRQNEEADSGMRRNDKKEEIEAGPSAALRDDKYERDGGHEKTEAGSSAEPVLSEAEGLGITDQGVDYDDPELFERRIFIKQNAAWLVEQELRKVKIDEEIAIGTATDPYQPIERVERVTRSILEVLVRRSGLRIGIITKSNLILRDVELLQEIARKSSLSLHITITTPDVELARKLEPRAPRPDLRFAAVKALREAGLRAGIMNCPLLPGITDNAIAMGEMARRAKEVDASFLVANTLFLKPCSKPTYFSFIREHFPHLEADMTRRFAETDFAAKPYAKRMSELLRAVCKKHGVGERSTHALLTAEGRKPVRRVEMPAQQSLFG